MLPAPPEAVAQEGQEFTMRLSLLITTGLLLAGLGLVLPNRLHGQIASTAFPVWHGELRKENSGVLRPAAERRISVFPVRLRAATRSHTGTGLLIGGLVGAAATTVFLIGFCDDPDTQCGADEIGRAVLFIAVPCAAVGALIGSLIRTEE
jgi:hypothetical protein